MSSEPMALEVRDVHVRYGQVTAVRGVDLDVPDGAVMALLGPSGCGKSTLLRAVAGLEPLAAGSVAWHGRDLAGVAVHDRHFGLMFQEHALFPHRNVAENVGFGLRMAGMGRADRRRRVDELLDLVGLAGFGDRTIGTLSGGQAQRVALARAVAPEPALLLLDEPLGSLDRELRDRLTHEIRRVVTDLGLTAVHVTHDHDEAMSIADHVALMADGRITTAGPVQRLLDDPGDVATATALGLETVWPLDAADRSVTPFGRVVGTGPEAVLIRPEAVLIRPEAVLIRPEAVLIRPEAVRVAVRSGFGPPGAGWVEAVVASSRHRAGAWMLDCRLADGRRIVGSHPERLDDGTEVLVSADLSEARPLRG